MRPERDVFSRLFLPWAALRAMAAFMVCLGVGCDRESNSDDTTVPAKITIGYFANLTHAQGVLAVASGDFQKAVGPATRIETKLFNAGPALIEALNAGEIDLGYVGPGPVINMHDRSRGKAIRVLSGAAANGVVIVARKGAGIGSLADLKGRKIATPQHGNTQDIAARHYVTSVLGQDHHDNVIPIANAEQVSMMTRGEFDAAWAPEPWGSRLIAEAGATLVAEEKDLWPNQEFMLTVLVASPQFLQRHPQVCEQMVRVHRTWTKRLQAEPQKYLPQLADALFALTQKRLPPGVLESSMGYTRFTDDANADTLKTMAQWMYDMGFARRLISTVGLVDDAILKKLEAEDAGVVATPL